MTSVTTLAPATARIAEIQARFAPSTIASSSSASGSASTTGAIDTASFSSVLSDVLGLTAASTDGDGSSIDISTLTNLLKAASSASSRTSASTLSSLLGARGATAANASSSGRADGNDVVAAAKHYLGVDYVWGGTDPTKGLDCSGFVQRAYRDVGIDLPRVSYDQAKVGTKVDSIDQARPGDLVAFGSPVDHIAIYVGDGKIIQAPHTGDVVRITDIRRPIATIRRVIPDTTVSGTTSWASTLGTLTSSGSAAASTAATGTGVTGIAGAGPYESLFVAAGNKYGLNPRLLAAVAKTESSFDPNARSSVGAIGLMQFMPSTAAGMGIDPTDPAQAIDGAARYLKTQLNRFGSIDLALAAYNAGPGAVQRAGGIPPYTETRNYVAKILGLMAGQSATSTTAGSVVGTTTGVLS